MCPKTLLRVAKYLMPASIATMMVGGYVGFVDHSAWSLQAQVLAHISIMLGAGLLKLSYVMHLNASKHLGINDYALSSAASDLRPLELKLPECCLAR